jgi:hypothetical protein
MGSGHRTGQPQLRLAVQIVNPHLEEHAMPRTKRPSATRMSTRRTTRRILTFLTKTGCRTSSLNLQI